jgi:beta-1,4-N-acetylglucosaminyltransferase
MSVLIVLGGGGHTFEMLKITENLKKENKVYIINHDDYFSLKNIESEKYYKIFRPRKPAEYGFKTLFRVLVSFFNSLLILLLIRPKIIITNGPAIGISIGLIGKLLRIPIIYIESICRVYRLSLSGRILLPYADLFIVQWPYLKKVSNKIIYAGRLF